MPDFALNKKDRDLLQSVITKVGLLPPKLFPPEEGKLPSSPGIYVAKPTSSIPSLSPDDPDVPGVQTCDIYQIVINNATDDPEILAVEAFTLQEVYNLSQKAVPTEWILVIQTKFGNWIAIPIDSPYGRVTGTLVEDITGTASDFEIDNVIPISGASPLTEVGSASETLTVQNVFDMSGDENGRVNAEFNKTSGDWEAYQMECPT